MKNIKKPINKSIKKPKFQAKKTKNIGKRKLLITVGSAFMVLFSIALIIVVTSNGAKTDSKTETNSRNNVAGTSNNTNIIIPISEVSEIANFYPVQIDGTKMEALAIKAPDGTIRTALNTCQVCYSSGKGYYEQEGSELVCKNCGNRFKINQIEVVKGGCNPIPIFDENKVDDGTNITISSDFLNENKNLFSNWKKL